MEVVCNRTLFINMNTGETIPVNLQVFENHIYNVVDTVVENGCLFYFLAERPEGVKYMARNFTPLTKVLAEISIEELISEEIYA